MKYLDTNEEYCVHHEIKKLSFKERSSLLGFKKSKRRVWSFSAGDMSLWLNFVVVIDLAKQKVSLSTQVSSVQKFIWELILLVVFGRRRSSLQILKIKSNYRKVQLTVQNINIGFFNFMIIQPAFVF